MVGDNSKLSRVGVRARTVHPVDLALNYQQRLRVGLQASFAPYGRPRISVLTHCYPHHVLRSVHLWSVRRALAFQTKSAQGNQQQRTLKVLNKLTRQQIGTSFLVFLGLACPLSPKVSNTHSANPHCRARDTDTTKPVHVISGI